MSDYKLSAGSAPAGADGTGEAPVRPPRRTATPNRHGAIARQLFTYTNYKNWADKVRTAWDREEQDDETPAAVKRAKR